MSTSTRWFRSKDEIGEIVYPINKEERRAIRKAWWIISLIIAVAAFFLIWAAIESGSF